MGSVDILDIHFRVGTHSEIDIKFRAIVAAEKSPDETMSDFIKTIVIRWYESNRQQQEEASAAEKVRQELMIEIEELREKVERGVATGPELKNDGIKEIKNNNKVSKLSAAW